MTDASNPEASNVAPSGILKLASAGMPASGLTIRGVLLLYRALPVFHSSTVYWAEKEPPGRQGRQG